jgi:hypothetical protein
MSFFPSIIKTVDKRDHSYAMFLHMYIMLRFVDERFITTLLDTFTEFMFCSNEKKILKK